MKVNIYIPNHRIFSLFMVKCFIQLQRSAEPAAGVLVDATEASGVVLAVIVGSSVQRSMMPLADKDGLWEVRTTLTRERTMKDPEWGTTGREREGGDGEQRGTWCFPL